MPENYNIDMEMLQKVDEKQKSSDMNFKVSRKIKFENLDKETAQKKIIQIDKERAEYYKHFTTQTWGDKDNYDLCIDTSKLGIASTINILENYTNNRIKNLK